MKLTLKLKPPTLHLFIAFTVLAATLFLYPVRTTLTRSALLLALAITTAAALRLLYKHPRSRPLAYALTLLLAAAALFLCLPGRPHDPAALRQSYISSLLSYQGTRYVWGGETHLGIDCSGLAQAALIEANLKQALRTANPALLRNALDIWAHRTPAHGLMDGYHGRTTPLPSSPPETALQNVDYLNLQPGDLAITSDGTHTLIYLGPQNGTPTWIESDPYPMKVIQLKLHQTPSDWWTRPVQLRRWKALQN